MAFTETQKQTYLSSGGVRCPFCGSTDIEGDCYGSDIGGVSQRITCYSCRGSWYDVYQLVDVVADAETKAEMPPESAADSPPDEPPAPARSPAAEESPSVGAPVMIVVSGGVVQDVYAPAETKIQLIDFDNLQQGDPFDPEAVTEPDGPPDSPEAQAVIAEALELTAQNLRQRGQPEAQDKHP